MVRASDLDTIRSRRFENDQEAKDEQARLANRDIERHRKRVMSAFVSVWASIRKPEFVTGHNCRTPSLEFRSDERAVRKAYQCLGWIGVAGVVTRASAYAGKGSVVTEEHAYDLYELLGLEAEARLPEIKQAYRWLQKRCHPDIAGEVGHDMAILLNDAYATLSDPMRRAAYDAVSGPRIPLWRIPVHLCGPSAQQKNFWPFFKKLNRILMLKSWTLSGVTWIRSRYKTQNPSNSYRKREIEVYEMKQEHPRCSLFIVTVLYKVHTSPVSHGIDKTPHWFSAVADYNNVGLQIRVERAEFDEFTGEPIYSKWLGPREENRAIFVNEVECIGCLKCALIASNTFAIENKYGRARAVGQWGDSESTINDAIRSCPVDCIS